MLLDIGLPFGEALIAGRSASGGILRPRGPGTVQPLRPTPDERRLLRARETLDRIEAQVAAGSTELADLGFWTIVASIKRDPVWVIELADQAGRIDRDLFRARVRRRVPVWVGTAAMIVTFLVGAVAIVLSAVWTGVAAGI